MDTLKKPLNDSIDDFIYNDEHLEIDVEMKNSAKEINLLYISKLGKETDMTNFRNRTIDVYLNEEILRLFTDKNYKSIKFTALLRDNFQSTESRGKYILGLEKTTLDCLLDIFSQISQNSKFFNMQKSVNKLLVKLI